MGLLHPTLVILSLLSLLGLACPAPWEHIEPMNIESPWADLPQWSKDWSPEDWNTAMDRGIQEIIHDRYLDRKKKDLTAPSSCASAWANQNAGAKAALNTANANLVYEVPLAGQSAPARQSALEGFDWALPNGQSLENYPSLESVFQQHPNLAQFIRDQMASSPALGNSNGQFYGRSSPAGKHPVDKLPEMVDAPSASVRSNQYYIIPSYRSAEATPQVAEDVNTIKSPQLYEAAALYRQQIQQALANGKQLIAGIPNHQLAPGTAPGTAEKITPVSPVLTTASFPVTALSFDPEEMRRVYGQYYVPPVFNLVQRQPNSLSGAQPGLVRDVLQYLLNQYESPNAYGIGVNRNQRLLPDISVSHEKILHGFTPFQKLPRQSAPQLPSFTGDNQLLPPNLYRNDKWEPKANLVVHDPVNLGEFEQSSMYQQYPARSTPCSRHKRQADIWGFYPELTPEAGRTTGPLPTFPGIKSSQYGQYGMDQPGSALPFSEDLRQSFTEFLEQQGLIRPQPNPKYVQARGPVSLSSLISGYSQLMPQILPNGSFF